MKTNMILKNLNLFKHYERFVLWPKCISDCFSGRAEKEINTEQQRQKHFNTSLKDNIVIGKKTA